MRAAIYLRVSTDEQAREGYSISAQRDRLTAYAQSQDWDIVDFYVDEGRSAKDTDRSELQRMLSDIRVGKIDVVLVYKLDRLTRSVLDLYQLLDEFEKYNCKFKSMSEVYDTTSAIGRMFITLVGALAQFEREQLGERVKFGMEQMALEGKRPGASVPFGYDDEMNVIEEQADIVREAFKKYINGYGDNRLAVWLNSLNTGRNWTSIGVGYMLGNPLYAGNLRWNYRGQGETVIVQDAVPAIVDKDIFEQAQRIRKVRSDIHPRQATSPYIFTGRIRCGRCGYHLRGMKSYKGKVPYVYYRCYQKINGKCDLPAVAEDLIETAFLEYMDSLKLNEEHKAITKDIATTHQDKINHQLIQQELTKIKERRKRWQYAWVNELLTDDEYRNHIEEDRKREEELLKQLEQSNSTMSEFDVIELASTFSTWKSLQPKEKKALLQILVETIVIDSNDDRKHTRGVGQPRRQIYIKDIKFFS